jgi:hypothetical protein
LSEDLWNKLGPTGTKDYFLHLDAGENANYPDGVTDNTHFQAHGAIGVARLIVNDLTHRRLVPGGTFVRLKGPIPDSDVVWP